MSQEDLYAFFVKVTDDQVLQDKLDLTKEVSDVAMIARAIGFKISGAEVLRAQAKRILSLLPHEQTILAAGGKVKAAANWGRHGKGYLEMAGFWILQIASWGHATASEQQVENFLSEIKKNTSLQDKLLAAKSYGSVAQIANEYGCTLSGLDWLKVQAEQILKLDDEKAECVASGADSELLDRKDNTASNPRPSIS